MTMLKVGGVLEASRIFEFFIEEESAFTCHWPGERSLRVAFHKGEWTLVKSTKDEKGEFMLLGLLSAFDHGLFSSTDEMMKGLCEALLKADGIPETTMRKQMGRILSKAVAIWIRDFHDLREITVIQHGRNSLVSPCDGSYALGL